MSEQVTPTQAEIDELRAITPKPWRDQAWIADRFVLDWRRFAIWCAVHFGMHGPVEAAERIEELDILSELAVIDGVAFRIPDACYQRITPDPATRAAGGDACAHPARGEVT